MPSVESSTRQRAVMSVGAMPTVSIIVVNYETRELTIACLEFVLSQTRSESYELVVVDNASTDGFAGAIRGTVPSAHLIASKVNLGFGAANNLAAKQARGEFLLLLNPDTVVLDSAIDRLIAFARLHPDAQIWGGRTFFGDLTLNPASCFRRMTLWNQFCYATGLGALFRWSPILTRSSTADGNATAFAVSTSSRAAFF